MSDLIERLVNGVVEHPKRWSGDTHYDLGGSVDYEATGELMNNAAQRILADAEALKAADELIEAIHNYQVAEETWDASEDSFAAAEHIIEQWNQVEIKATAYRKARGGEA